MRTFWTAFMAAMLLLAGGAAPAAAKGEVVRAVGYETTCSFVAGQEWVSGKILHIRGEVDTTRTVGVDVETNLPDPRLTATNTVILNLNLNLETGNGTVFGTTTLQPDGIDGAWETTFTGSIREGAVTIRANGHGTGALAGQRLKAAIEGVALGEAPQLCGGGELNASKISWELRP